MKKISIFLVSFVFSLAVNAQVPQALNYQAIARHINGSIISGQPIGVRFSILDASATGATVFQETHQITTNNFGLFTLSIGKGTLVSGTLAGVNWGSGTKFLKVEIAPLGGTNFQVQGTTQLLSVPYALYAEKSGTAGPQGPAGPNGLSILNGATNPLTTLGVNGDFYINTSANQLFGPKTNGAWGSGVSLIGATGPAGPQGNTGAAGPIGPAGPTGPIGLTGAPGAVGATGSQGLPGSAGPAGAMGPQGATGANGNNGKTILNGITNPGATIGLDGDFYINTLTNQIYGPKTGGSWGAGVSLIGPAGVAGLKSLIDLQNFSATPTCLLGGVRIKSGIDQNSNNVLDANEIDNTKDICFTQSIDPRDKLIIIPLFSAGGNTTGTAPTINGMLMKFNKNNYPLVDSIIFIGDPYVGASGNTSIVTLYNRTDNVPITNATLTTSNLFTSNGSNFLQTGNLYSFLPNYEIVLGVSFHSGTAGMFAASNYGGLYLYLYRR